MCVVTSTSLQMVMQLLEKLQSVKGTCQATISHIRSKKSAATDHGTQEREGIFASPRKQIYHAHWWLSLLSGRAEVSLKMTLGPIKIPSRSAVPAAPPSLFAN